MFGRWKSIAKDLYEKLYKLDSRFHDFMAFKNDYEFKIKKLEKESVEMKDRHRRLRQRVQKLEQSPNTEARERHSLTTEE